MTATNNEHNVFHWHIEHGESPWDVTPNLTAFLPIYATTEADGVRWRLVLDAVGDRLACTSLTVDRFEDGPAITSELLRTFAIGRHLHAIVTRSLVRDDPSNPFAWFGPPADLLSGGPTDDALRYVANVYRVAYTCGLKPTKAVTDLGLSRSTAERWLRTARERGML